MSINPSFKTIQTICNFLYRIPFVIISPFMFLYNYYISYRQRQRLSLEASNPSKELINIIERKRAILQDHLNKPYNPQRINIHVRREYIIEDSFNGIMPWIGKSNLHHAKIFVQFSRCRRINKRMVN